MNAVARLTQKLNTKLEEQNFYEAHQLYRTIYFRLNRDINYSSLEADKEDLEKSLANRVKLIKDNPNYEVLLNFLSEGVEKLLSLKEIISALDLLQTFIKQFDYVFCDTKAKPTFTEETIFYHKFLKKWFFKLLELFKNYTETGYEVIRNRHNQSNGGGGISEGDFVNDRDNLMEKIMQLSNNIQEVEGKTDSERKIRNAYVREFGVPEMHLMNGRLLVRNHELRKARNCMLFSDNSFELAKFIYFFYKIEHNKTEFELVLIKHLLRVFNIKLFLGAKPGIYRGHKRDEKMKKLKIDEFSENETKILKRNAFKFAKEVFIYYLTITKFFLVKDGQIENIQSYFKQFPLLKFVHFFLIIIEELLRIDQIISPKMNSDAEIKQQLMDSFRFRDQNCFQNEDDWNNFMALLSNKSQNEPGFSLGDSKDEKKMYLLKLFYKLRIVFYVETLDFHRKLDPDFDLDFVDRVFFVYFNDSVPNCEEVRNWDKIDGTVEPFFGGGQEARRAGRQNGGNLIFNLLGGFGEFAQGGAGGGSGAGSLSDLFNEFLR